MFIVILALWITVKPALGNHPFIELKVVAQSRWSLNEGSLTGTDIVVTIVSLWLTNKQQLGDTVVCLQCFDTVGWAAGRASDLQKMGGWWRWALVSPDGVAPSRMVNVSASVNLPLHHKVQKFSSGTSSPGWSLKKGCKTVVVCGGSWLAECWE